VAASRPEDEGNLVYSAFAGLRNTVAPERLSPQELAAAVNVDLDDAGQIRRRRGYTRVAEGNYHSLHQNGDAVYVVRNGDLCALYPDFSYTVLRTGCGAAPLAYVDIGTDTYFASSVVSGVTDGLTTQLWGDFVTPGKWESPVVNPTANLPEVGGVLVGAPPLATSLAYYNGRVYLANGPVLWATELYRYHVVDKTRNYLYFEQPITALAAVTDGLFVGTEGATYFIEGEFRTMRRREALRQGVIPGSLVRVDPTILPDPMRNSRQAVMFMTTAGLCAGVDSGVCYNLTADKFDFPTATTAAAMFREQDGMKQYIGVLDSAGTPVNNSRFGDYMDAEIRRFEG
jgi:hypothetical protein